MTDPAENQHLPVMLSQALEFLNLRPGLCFVDATVGGGGHLQSICDRLGNQGTVIGIDRDLASLNKVRQKIGKRAQLVHANYSEIEEIIAGLGINTISGGILADLGVSSMQLDDPARGFSFLRDGPLDMRMDPSTKFSAQDLVNTMPEGELADIIYRYGEERKSRQIARKIVESRPLKGTLQLAALVAQCLRRPAGKYQRGNRDLSHPATRTFQALRIAVNDELGSLEKFLRSALKILAPGARLVVITFHSLEDRLVKQILRESALSCTCPPRQPICTCSKRPELLIITRKPVVADEAEVLANPRSRSAKLRAGEKLP